MKIRVALIEDSESIARVQVNSNRTTYRGIMPDDYLNNLSCKDKAVEWKEKIRNRKNHETVYVVESEEDGIIGFFSISETRTNEIAERELLSIYILEGNQKKGVGRRVFKKVSNKYLKDNICTMMLWTLKDNSSRGFYERLGGKVAGTRVIERGTAELEQVAYKWDNIQSMRS